MTKQMMINSVGVSGSLDCSVKMWDVDNGGSVDCIKPLSHHELNRSTNVQCLFSLLSPVWTTGVMVRMT